MAFGIFFVKEKISAMFSHFSSLHFCVELMDAAEFALRFINYDMLCMELHCITLQCNAVLAFLCAFYLILALIYFFPYHLSAPFFPCCFSSDFTLHWNPMCIEMHCTFGAQLCIFVLCLSSLFSSFFFQGSFVFTRMGFSWSLHSTWSLNSVRHCWACCHEK